MSEATIEEIAKLLNPKPRGWIHYHDKLAGRELHKLSRILIHGLMKWVENKYKLDLAT